jgi:hypothetical protein
MGSALFSKKFVKNKTEKKILSDKSTHPKTQRELKFDKI